MRRWCLTLAIVAAVGCGEGKRDSAPAAVPRALRPVGTKAPADGVLIRGVVLDITSQQPVPDVEVALRSPARQSTTRTNDKGEFEFRGAAGNYRAFVIDEKVISVGLQDRVRLDNGPHHDVVGIADETLMPVMSITEDTDGIELAVAPSATLTGYVWDPDGREVAGVAVRLRPLTGARSLFGELRPVLATDGTVTDSAGRFTLRVPAGHYELEASHEKFAGVRGDTEFELDAGQKVDSVIYLARGCVITGRVVRADGRPAADGAIETMRASGTDFGPAGRIDAGGIFRWVTTNEEEVILRAWPWHSPPSPAKTFNCKDGKRYAGVVLKLPERSPDLSGMIVDARGTPIPFAHVDVTPRFALPPGIVGSQQERADASGSWHIYDVRPGNYKITASAPGLGVIETTINAPRQDLRLQLGGTGRIRGTTTDLVAGSFDVAFLHCGNEKDPQPVAHESRTVIVRGGRFTIDNAPACALTFIARWREHAIEGHAVVEPGATAHIELALGAPREKTIAGTVRDRDGKPVGGARVTAVIGEREATSVRSDDAGQYTLKTVSGAQLVAGDGEYVGRRTVGRANVDREQIDLVLDAQ